MAIQLAAIGVQRLQLVDFDIVEESNLVTQAYYHSDLGKEKIKVTGTVCKNINPAIKLDYQCSKYTRKTVPGNIIFTCPDNMSARKTVFSNARFTLLIDSRMAGEVCRILTVHDEITRDYYETTLFTSQEAHQGRCTQQSTVFCANITAALMISQLTKYLRELPIIRDYMCNLLSNEMTIHEEEKK